MTGTARPSLLLLSGLFTMNVGCGQIDLPVTFALQGENTITLDTPFFGTLSSTLIGGAEATVTIDLNPFVLFKPQGLAALISLDRVLMAGTEIHIGTLNTGIVCVYDDPDNPGGGIAYLRPLHQEGDFNLSFNTLISPTSPQLQALFPDPLPFQAEISTTVPVTLAQLLGLLTGGGDGGLELSQEIQAVLPEEIPLLGGSIVTADLTLATVETFPTDPMLDHCEDFLAGP